MSVLAHPSGSVKNAWREHRTVVIPEFQGLGIGVRISDEIAKIIVGEGCRYFSKTAHPAMGEYRERSNFWFGTSKNKKLRKDYKSKNIKGSNDFKRHANRVCYSHEFKLIEELKEEDKYKTKEADQINLF